MASSGSGQTIIQNVTPHAVLTLLGKLSDADPDFRFMSLNDLHYILTKTKPGFLASDYNIAARTVDGIVGVLDDQNGEVQNLAVKCLGPLSTRVAPSIVGPLIHKLAQLELKNSIDVAIPAMALRAVVMALPRPKEAPAKPSKEVSDSYLAISRVLIPRLVGPAAKPGIQTTATVTLPSIPQGILQDEQLLIPEIVDVLIEAIRCFGPMLSLVEIEAMQQAVMNLLEHDGCSLSVKRRAVVALSILATYLPDNLLEVTVKRAASILSLPETTATARKNYITIVGSMARSIPARFGKHLPSICPCVLETLGEDELLKLQAQMDDGNPDLIEFNELREAALVALEAFVASCPEEMEPYSQDTISCCLRYLKYDPNTTIADDDVMEVDEEDDADQDDELDGFDDFEDDDDASWKVRRCAAKVLHTFIATTISNEVNISKFYTKTAPMLIKRIDDREETVRLEVIAGLSLLIRKTGEAHNPSLAIINDDQPDDSLPTPINRKRRRQSSTGIDAAEVMGLVSPIWDQVPTEGPRAELARLTPGIVKQSVRQLKGKSIPSKQAMISLLDNMVFSQRGGLNASLADLVPPIVEIINPSGPAAATTPFVPPSSVSSATPATLKMAALKLIGHINQTHSSGVLQPYITSMTDVVVDATNDKFYKITGEAIRAAEEIVKTITPPRAKMGASKNNTDLDRLFNVLMERSTATGNDAEVRQRAIHALGVLLGRTSTSEGVKFLDTTKRNQAFQCLCDRLKNETTRLYAVSAIDTIMKCSSKDLQLDSQWFYAVAIELSGQLRKTSRNLRVACAHALRSLISSPATHEHLDGTTTQIIVDSLLPGITAKDSHMLGPSLLVLAALVTLHPGLVMTDQIILALCDFLRDPLARTVLDQMLALATNVGKTGKGEYFMKALLQHVSVSGDSSVVGKVIGALLVSSGYSAGGVNLDSFVKELDKSAKVGDEPRIILCLAILGEVAMRTGAETLLKLDMFLGQFRSTPDDVSRAAAVALGQAATGNLSEHLPILLAKMDEGPNTQYLIILSLKEILNQAPAQSESVKMYSQQIWNSLTNIPGSVDTRVACAECVGRLVLIEPERFMENLTQLLGSESKEIRGMAVQAVRFLIQEGDDTFDKILNGTVMTQLLLRMLGDSESEIRRLGLTTLNSAAHNKPHLMMPQIPQLIPFVLGETKINPELIREVRLGPFTVMKDDGLESRMSAYDTLYALMETAYARINHKDLFDRVIDGLKDENDIRSLCNLMVSKLSALDPDETLRRLDAIAERYKAILSVPRTENAVKQEIEKQQETIKSILRVSMLLDDRLISSGANGANGAGVASGAGGASSANSAGLGNANGNTNVAAPPPATWAAYWDWVKREFDRYLKTLKEENKDLHRRM